MQGFRILARPSRLHGRSCASAGPPSFHIRGIAVEPGVREKALLEEDPALKQFKSTKKTVRFIQRLGDVLVICVAAGCVYQIYDIARMRKAANVEQSSKT